MEVEIIRYPLHHEAKACLKGDMRFDCFDFEGEEKLPWKELRMRRRVRAQRYLETGRIERIYK